MLMALAVSLLAILSVAMLKDPLRGYLWNSTFTGFAELLPLTSWTAVRVWIFWAVASAILALTLRRIDPHLELFDAFIGGAAGTWIFAYLAGNLLGPIGLFRPLTIWLMAICAAVWLWRHHSNIALSSPSAGQKLALLACVLMTIGALPLQLGSPIPPVMDVLNIPAAAQRVVTFNRYLPFDNDPYGYWTPLARVPALDLFYAMLTIGSFTKLASVAEMAALVPMSCLMIFATYRLGRAVIGDVGGGIASILLFASTILTRTQSMRGTAVALALVAVGLGFFTDPDRRPIKTAVGTLALATAVASHAIIGGLAMATAGFVTLFDLFADDLAGALVEACCLFGGLMIAFPEFSIALNLELPYPILPASELIGLAVISYTASRLGRRPSYETLFVKCVTASLFLALLWLLLWSPHSMFMLDELHNSFPELLALSVLGLVAALLLWSRQTTAIWVIGIALLTGCLAEFVSALQWLPFIGEAGSFGWTDVGHKIGEYWYPYFLVFPAAVVFDWVYRRWSKWLSVVALLAFVMLLLGAPPDKDLAYVEHGLGYEWASEWLLAKQGWWGSTLDTRWAQSPAELALNDVLRTEISEGRITTATHIVHVTPHTIMFQDVLLFSVYTGIDDDLYVIKPVVPLDQGGTNGSRLYPISMLPAALAKRPPYLVVHGEAPPWLTLPPAGYDEIFNRGGVRLFRRHDLSAGSPA